MKKPVLILVRGLPGSGKTTLAHSISSTLLSEDILSVCHAADNFFSSIYNRVGEYKFDPKMLSYAHMGCLADAAVSLYNDYHTIIHNTFTQRWEMEEYFKLADILGVTALVIECKGNFKSVHNVPESVIQKMKDRWEDFEYGSEIPQYHYDPSKDSVESVVRWVRVYIGD